jgi:hypothetical protein
VKRILYFAVLLIACDESPTDTPSRISQNPLPCNPTTMDSIVSQVVHQNEAADSLIIVHFGLCTEEYAVLSAGICIDDIWYYTPRTLCDLLVAAPESIDYPHYLFDFQYDWTTRFAHGDVAEIVVTPYVSAILRPLGEARNFWGSPDTLSLSK